MFFVLFTAKNKARDENRHREACQEKEDGENGLRSTEQYSATRNSSTTTPEEFLATDPTPAALADAATAERIDWT